MINLVCQNDFHCLILLFTKCKLKKIFKQEQLLKAKQLLDKATKHFAYYVNFKIQLFLMTLKHIYFFMS